MFKYLNRKDAGLKLAAALQSLDLGEDVVVLALPRGGVPVGYEVAKTLAAPLDVFIVRKLGVPGHTELAMGAIATGDVIVFNEDIIGQLNISKAEIESVIKAEREELKRRELKYRGGKTHPDLQAKTVILVDDGIATGATMRAAIEALRLFKPAKIILAVPCADKHLIKNFNLMVDEIVCPLQPEQFYAVGAWYEDFTQTEDEEVRRLLEDASGFATNAH